MNHRQQRLNAFALASVGLSLVSGIALALLFFAPRFSPQAWGKGLTLAVGVIWVIAQGLAAFVTWWVKSELEKDLTAARSQLETVEQLRQAEETLRDELERCRAERERLSSLVETFAAPLIPMAKGVVVVPLSGRIDAARMQRIGTNLLQGVERHRARVVILDLTGVIELAQDAVQQLPHVISGVGLMGGHVVLTGIDTEMARTLLEWDVDLHVEARRDLQAGIAYATELIASQNRRPVVP